MVSDEDRPTGAAGERKSHLQIGHVLLQSDEINDS
jgi:hypothetical protein